MRNHLFKVRLLLLAVPLLASTAYSLHSPALQPLNITSERPALVFESYLADQSRIVAESRPVISEEFHFRNQGASTVKITGVEPSCGCLRPQLSSTQIEPGQRGRITLPVRTVNEPAGLREYMVNIHYEDPRPRTVSLTWRVQLPEKKLLIEPRVLMILGNLAEDESLPVRISDFRAGKTDTPLRITEVSAAPALIQAAVGGQTVSADASETVVNVRFSSKLPPGKHRGVVTVRTEDPDYPALQIPVIVGKADPELKDCLKVSPEMGRVVIRGNKPEESAGTSIVLSMPAEWTIDRVETFPVELQATAESLEPDSEDSQKTTLAISVTAMPPAGIQQGLVTLHFNSPAGPQMLTVPMSLVWL